MRSQEGRFTPAECWPIQPKRGQARHTVHSLLVFKILRVSARTLLQITAVYLTPRCVDGNVFKTLLSLVFI
jgi:hypothetical protein